MVNPTSLSANSVSVLLADSSIMNCELLSQALRKQSLKIVGCAVDSQGVRDCVRIQAPDIAVVAVNLRDGPMAGFHVVQELQEISPHTKSILLLDSSDEELVVDSFRGGAKGVVSRSHILLKQLSKAITCVASGQVWATSHELQLVLKAFAAAAPLRLVKELGRNSLSRREEEVVELVAEGLSNREIAQRLALSEHTIKNYLFHIFEKLGVSSRVELVLFAIHHLGRAKPASATGPSALTTEKKQRA